MSRINHHQYEVKLSPLRSVVCNDFSLRNACFVAIQASDGSRLSYEIKQLKLPTTRHMG
jgi:hypothetical protein